MGVTMKKLTVSGHPGSGTSTLVEGLKNHFGWLSVNGGEIFRSEAKNRGMTLSEFGRLCSDDQSVDLELDEILRNYIADDETNIIESRLAGWWAFKMEAECRRIWLNVSEEERARRVASRENISIEIAIEANAKRLAVDNKRYQNMYGFVPDDPTPYTDIIDATNQNAEQVLAQVITILGGE